MFTKETCLLSRYREIYIAIGIHVHSVILNATGTLYITVIMSFLHKISSGTIDAVKFAQTLRNEDKISSDVCLMFGKIYLQKCEGYFAGDLVGCNSEGELYKGLVCFMIFGLKNSIPYVIKSSPETKINAIWLTEDLIVCLGILSNPGFNARAMVCDNHPSNVPSFKSTSIFQDPGE